MWPCNLEDGFVFFGVKGIALGVDWRWDRSEEILAEHLDDLGVHGLGDDLSVVRHIVEKLVERQSLDLFWLHVCALIIEIEDDIALVKLLHE